MLAAPAPLHTLAVFVAAFGLRAVETDAEP